MKVYDCCTFFNETDLLKIRMEFLYDHVDQFIISEANFTHSGKPKLYNFEVVKGQFSRWIDKIVYLKYEAQISGITFSKPDAYDPSNGAWKIEVAQRDHLATALKGIDDDSLVIQSDVDEIWNPDKLTHFKEAAKQLGAVRLGMQLHYFFMNCRGVSAANSIWVHPFCVTGGALKSLGSLSQLRTDAQLQYVPDAGWHFSYLGGQQAVIDKIEAFAHQELNIEKNKEQTRIANCINLGLDPFDRADCTWAFFPVDAYPAKLAALMRLNPKLIKAHLI